MIRLLYALIISCLITATSCNSTGKENDSEEIAEEKNEKKFEDEKLEDDMEFLVEATSGGLMEIELGKIAEQNAGSENIKDLARTMLEDQLKTLEELKALAAKKNVSIPNIPGEEYQKKISKLSKLKGPAFDVEYLKVMEKDHEEDVERYEKEALNGKEPEIRAFASGKVPGLKQHLDMARALHQTIKEK